MPEDARTALAADLVQQARACARHGSALYAAVLQDAAADAARGGPTWDVLAGVAAQGLAGAVPLRLMAAVHRLVLQGRAPDLAAHYPSAGGTAGTAGAWAAFRAVLDEHRDELRALVTRPCQTNEVGRCAALIGGFLTVAAETQLPLRLLEIGASAGLNLRWDHYRYADGALAWGDRDSPVQLTGRWEVPQRLLGVPVAVNARRGCDPQPLDPLSSDGRLALAASVWADQTVRFERLRGALQVAARVPAAVDAAPVGAWLPARLAETAAGTATVVYHSVVLQYLDDRGRAALRDALVLAGRRASAGAPLAWLRMEPEQPLRSMGVRLTVWPGGAERLLATAGAHGDPVRWRAR